MKHKAVSILNDLGVKALVQDLLAPGTPLAVLSAQLLYFSEPLWATSSSEDDVRRWAELLESVENSQD